MAYQFLANVIIRGKIETLTGMHIGGSKEKLEIGGVDSPVIRDPFENVPYIPGSSLKGKVRMLLEYSDGDIDVVEKDGKLTAGPYSTDDINNPICRIFGNFTKGTAGGPTRLTIRDAYPDKATREMWKDLDSELLYTELKPENSIDRLTSEANPRFLERVVRGSKFNLEMVYGIYDFQDDGGQKDKEYLKILLNGLKLLEHSGVGGSISRGYGQIKFHMAKPLVVRKEDYLNDSESYILASKNSEELEYNLSLNSPELLSIKI
jgi:CRISPR-associated protein Csm3